MSMTFWIPEAPTKEVREACSCAQMAPSYLDDEPDWRELDLHANKNCGMCKGSGSFIHDETLAPAINMANANCRDVLVMIGLSPDDAGTISPGEASNILQEAIKALNTEIVERFAREPFRDGRVIECGTTPDTIRYRIREVMKVLKYGIEHRQHIVWS